MAEAIPVYRPLIEKEEIEACEAALRMGWLGMGSYVARFEEELKGFIEAQDRYVAAVSTGHAALHLGLLIAGVKAGDEVITPAFNNIADFQAILATGARPVFCDIRPDTLCVDPDKLEELIGPRTRAIVVMDYFCFLSEHDRIAELAQRRGLRIIHDAAHSLGSRHRGRSIGSFSDICMFSFDPVKTITCIDGGALVVRTEEELRAIHELRLMGMGQPAEIMYQNQRAWTYDVKRVGYRYHMANLHAALGLAQLAKLQEIAATRVATCRLYNKRLGGIGEVQIPRTDFDDIVPFQYFIRVPPEVRDAFRVHLRERQIDTGIHWQPGHWFTLLKDCRRGDLSVTDCVGREIVSLPLHSRMKSETVERVSEAVGAFFNGR